MIRNLVFDFGKVLVDYDFERVIRDFFHQGDHLEEYCRIVLSDAFMNRCDLGVEPLEEILRQEQEAHPQLAAQLQLFYDRRVHPGRDGWHASASDAAQTERFPPVRTDQLVEEGTRHHAQI